MTPKRRAFFSFHYERDAWRAAQIRNAGTLDGNEPVTDNQWETIRRGGKSAIQKWIDSQISTRSCTVVLIANETSERDWIQYEIIKSLNERKGLVGIYIHNLKDRYGRQDFPGKNPFDKITITRTGQPLSSVVKDYNVASNDSQRVYATITNNLQAWVEEAIQIRHNFA